MADSQQAPPIAHPDVDDIDEEPLNDTQISGSTEEEIVLSSDDEIEIFESDDEGKFDEEEIIEEEFIEEEYDEEEIVEEIVEDGEVEGQKVEEETIGESMATTPSPQTDAATGEPSVTTLESSSALGETQQNGASQPLQIDPDGVTDYAGMTSGDDPSEHFASQTQSSSPTVSASPPYSSSHASLSASLPHSASPAQSASPTGTQSDIQKSDSDEKQSKPGVSIQPSQSGSTAVDVENQQRAAQIAPAPQYQSNQQVYLETKARKQDISSSWYWIGCFLVLALLGVAGVMGWWLAERTGNDTVPKIEEDDAFTPAPTLAPTIGFTTPFDPIRGNCDFMGVLNPHVIDQCTCLGEIQIIAEDVRRRYASHRRELIPTLYRDFDEEINDCTPRNQALVWLSSANDYDFNRDERIERYALATVFSSLNGEDWDTRTDWLSSGSVCMWSGIGCRDNSVLDVLIEGNNAVGTVPPEVALLENMERFLAARNDIRGVIPDGIFAVPTLRVLDLSFNAMTGPISSAVGDTTKLEQLILENNFLTGRISRRLGLATNLNILNVASNQLEGDLPFEMFALTALRELNFRGNKLQGSIPAQISQFSELERLALGPNNFSGTLPESIGDLSNLQFLSIENVGIGGRLPALLGNNLKQLVELSISDTKVGGDIDESFGDLPNLITMNLRGNQLRGIIPRELGNLQNLTMMDLGNNLLEGVIPDSLGSMPKLLELRLDDNQLVGGVPEQLAALTKLQILRLDGNRLVDRVVDAMCALREKDLFEFVVDCPDRSGPFNTGVICSVPTCCTFCRA